MKVGIIGAGHIAEKMAKTLNKLEGFEAYAIASRSLEKANKFKEEFSFEVSYGSYQELVEDPNVELVYIATPHSCHFEQMMMCLNANKPVLCEKVITTSSSKTREIYSLFEEKGLFLAEALWTSYMPSREIIKNIISLGAIGKIKKMEAHFEVPLMHKERVRERSLGGGVAMDIGLYPFSFVLRTLGFDYDEILINKLVIENDVDIAEEVEFSYGKIKANCYIDGTKQGSKQVRITGSEGYILIDGVTNPTSILIYDKKNTLIDQISCETKYGGFEFELKEAKRCIENKLNESPLWTHEQSIKLAEVIDIIVH